MNLLRLLRQFFFLALVIYLLAFAICLVYLIHYNAEIGPSLPLVLITEPWSWLFGMLLGDEVSDYYMGSLSVIGVVALVVSGALNAAILWFLYLLYRWAGKSN
jgi:hypothetical protein